MKRNSTITQPQFSLRTSMFSTWGKFGRRMVAVARSQFEGFVHLTGGSINTILLADILGNFGELAHCSKCHSDINPAGLTVPTWTGDFSSYLNRLEPKQPLRSGWCDLTYSEAPT